MSKEPEWIEHDGSAACPVPAGHDVEVRLRRGDNARGDNPQCWVWLRYKLGGCITHYRDWTAFEQQQASAGEVPEWAVARAYNLARDFTDDGFVEEGHLAQAFARYIAANEPAPVDPLREALESAAKVAMIGQPSFWNGLDALAAELRARGVTVAKGGE